MIQADAPMIALKLGVTRKQVCAWYQRRRNNGFPEPVAFKTRGCRPKHQPRSPRLWDLNEVVRWHAGYIPSRGGAGMHVKNRRDDS